MQSDQATHTPQPGQEEFDAARKVYREEIHKNRNLMTITVQIGRHMERASKTLLDAANEMIAENQRNRERIH